MKQFQKLFQRLKKIESHDLIRRETEIRTIETILKVGLEFFEDLLTKMEKRIEHLEKNQYSGGNDKGKKLPGRWWLKSTGSVPKKNKK